MAEVKINPQDETARVKVISFLGYINELKKMRLVYEELFKDDRAKELIEKTANQFFLDIQNVFTWYFFLVIAKVTEPYKNKKGNHENFTVSEIIQGIDWPKDVLNNLRRLSQLTKTIRDQISPAGKLMSDGEGISLPEATLECHRAITILEEIADTMYMACFGCACKAVELRVPGDVFDFKYRLRQAAAFQKMLSQSEGEEWIKLAGKLRLNDHPLSS